MPGWHSREMGLAQGITKSARNLAVLPFAKDSPACFC